MNDTLRLENGVYPRLVGHLARLAASALALGFSYVEERVRLALDDLARRDFSGVRRVRLTLAHDGSLALAHARLDDGVGREWSAVIASERLPADDYLRRHKTTVRGVYDAALAGLPAPDVFDAIFLNARGEVCEGARSNVFVVGEDGVWRTPPLSCGLLPGVMRRALLEAGRAVEQVLTREDLLAARGIYLANALRGVIRVRF